MFKRWAFHFTTVLPHRTSKNVLSFFCFLMIQAQSHFIYIYFCTLTDLFPATFYSLSSMYISLDFVVTCQFVLDVNDHDCSVDPPPCIALQLAWLQIPTSEFDKGQIVLARGTVALSQQWSVSIKTYANPYQGHGVQGSWIHVESKSWVSWFWQKGVRIPRIHCGTVCCVWKYSCSPVS